MKYERDWVRQESSRRRLDGLHELCQIAFAGVNLASIDYIPSCEKDDYQLHNALFQGIRLLMTSA